jgi:Tol biopolymer transport system component
MALLLALAACGAGDVAAPLVGPGTAAEPPTPVPPAPAATATPTPTAAGAIAFAKGHDVWIFSDASARQLTRLGAVQNPAWSPGGSMLAFDRAGKNSADLWLMPYPDGPPQPLTSNAASRVDANFWEMQPAWSPDGKLLVYASDRGRVRSGTLDLAAWRMDVATRARTQIGGANLYTGGIDYPSWRPGSNQALYTSWAYLPNDPNAYGQLVLLDVQTTKGWALTDNGETAMQASWSPDGQRIAFVRRLAGQDQIWLARVPYVIGANSNILDGAGLLLEGTNAHPVWSPSGDAIAYIGLQDGSFDLFLQPLTSGFLPDGKPRQLTRGLHVDADSAISWRA